MKSLIIISSTTALIRFNREIETGLSALFNHVKLSTLSYSDVSPSQLVNRIERVKNLGGVCVSIDPNNFEISKLPYLWILYKKFGARLYILIEDLSLADSNLKSKYQPIESNQNQSDSPYSGFEFTVDSENKARQSIRTFLLAQGANVFSDKESLIQTIYTMYSLSLLGNVHENCNWRKPFVEFCSKNGFNYNDPRVSEYIPEIHGPMEHYMKQGPVVFNLDDFDFRQYFGTGFVTMPETIQSMLFSQGLVVVIFDHGKTVEMSSMIHDPILKKEFLESRSLINELFRAESYKFNKRFFVVQDSLQALVILSAQKDNLF
ncbi:MAG: hypothetical protein ACRCXZ_00275 [Patescibacteria group bacterium]